ncbi:hypothetical protein Tco_0319111 [Tanacetum coccineum]
MTPATISSGLMPNPPPSTMFVPPSRTDWVILFQPLFDELFNPPPSVDFPAPEVIAPTDEVVALEPVVSNSTPSSTIVDQDAPSPSNSQTTPETPPPVIPNDVEEDNHDIEVVQVVLWYLDSGCSKHMTEDLSQLTNFVSKFLGTVKFGNDHVAKIMGYGDYQSRNVTISRVYYVEGLGHNLFSVG